MARSIIAVGPCSGQLVLNVPERAKNNSGVLLDGVEYRIGADGANVAIALAEFGVKSHFIGNNVGADPLGQHVLSILNNKPNLTHSVLQFDDAQTPIGVNISAKNGDREWYFLNPYVDKQLNESDLKMITSRMIVYVDSYHYTFDAAHRVIKHAYECGAETYTNLGQIGLIIDKCKHRKISDIVSLSKWVQISLLEQDNANEISGLLKKLGANNILLTMGDKGAWLLSDAHKLTMAAPKVDVVNPSGAGAYFSAGYLYGYRLNWTEQKCLQFAILTASFYIQTLSVVKLDDVLEFLQKSLQGC